MIATIAACSDSTPTGNHKKRADLVAALKGAQHDTIAPTGHADQLGAIAYNPKLSERRADAVKQYLIGKGLDAGKISASGKGQTQPVTKVAACKDKIGLALHVCLQPRRRVDIEVTGSKTISVPAAVPAGKPGAKPVAK